MDYQELWQRFALLTTAHIADACIRARVPVRCGPAALQAVVAGSRVAGRVRPARHAGSVDIFLEAIEASAYGRAFAVSQPLIFAAIVALALIGASLLQRWLGLQGVFAAAAVTGVADVHAAAITLGQMVSGANLGAREGALALSVAFTTNAIVKCIFAVAGGAPYAGPVVGAIAFTNVIVLGALWLS